MKWNGFCRSLAQIVESRTLILELLVQKLGELLGEKKKPGVDANPVRIRGRSICVGKPIRLTLEKAFLWPKGSILIYNLFLEMLGNRPTFAATKGLCRKKSTAV